MSESPSLGSGPSPSEPPPRKFITPEERQRLGTPRVQPTDEYSPGVTLKPPQNRSPQPVEEHPFHSPPPDRSPEPGAAAEPRTPRQRGVTVVEETKSSRRLEMQKAFIVVGILLIIVAIFWAGRQFDRVRYMILTRMNANELEGGPAKFPELTSEELVESALAAEKKGEWADAGQRFIEAKRKDRGYQGILFRIGKSSYDRGDWAGADRALEQSIKFGENIAVANHLRGVMAVRRHDLSAAERYFEAATKAEPFVADFFYFWGETLRLNQKPREAIRRYQQAISRTPNTSDATLCQFKIRLARIETAEAAALAEEIKGMRQAGPLSVDWLMTDAALQLHAGKVKEAAQLISEARAAGVTALFVTCVGDTIFLKASEVHPDIAAVAAITPPPK